MKSLGTVLGFAARDLEDVCAKLHSRNDDELIAAVPLDAELTYSLIRECWLLDFVAHFLTELFPHDTPTPHLPSLKEAASRAYKNSLAPHHSAFVRFAVSAALLLLPSRESFLLTLANGKKGLATLPADLARFVQDVKAVKTQLEAVLEK